jgi:hypothetical protein
VTPTPNFPVVPFMGFVVAPNLDWLYQINRIAYCAQGFAKEVKLPTPA